MMLLKITLFAVFGVMQCVYAVRGSKTHYFPHTVHYCCSSMLRLSEMCQFLQSSLLSDSTVSVHKGCNEQYRLNNTQLVSFFYF